MSFVFRIDNELRLTSWLFLKLLALIFFAAFVSLYGQIAGLVGPNGILPLGEFQDYLNQRHGSEAYWWLPTIFWLGNSDVALQGATVAGAVLSLLLLLGVMPRISLLLMTLLYLSLYQAGQIFLNFQWDYLLLETGLLAIFLVRGPSWLVLLLFHWLLFRLRFLSGISKLLSGDPSWSSLTTLNYYFETQPLPHWGSWYAHQLPEWLLQAGTALVLFSELVVPFFIFLPRRLRISGRAVQQGQPDGESGIAVAGVSLLPFLLAARASSQAPDRRPVFAEGLASSYEAFLHTRLRCAQERGLPPHRSAVGRAGSRCP